MKSMFAYDSLEISRCKQMGALFAVYPDVSLAHDGKDGPIQLSVYAGGQVDLEIFTTIVGGNEASIMT